MQSHRSLGVKSFSFDLVPMERNKRKFGSEKSGVAGSRCVRWTRGELEAILNKAETSLAECDALIGREPGHMTVPGAAYCSRTGSHDRTCGSCLEMRLNTR